MQIFLAGPLADPELVAALVGDAAPCHPALTVDGVHGAVIGPLAGDPLDRVLFHGAVHGAQLGETQLCGPGEIAGDMASLTLPGSGIRGLCIDGAPLPEPWLAIWREAAEEIAANHAQRSAEEVASRLPMIWSRAASRLRAHAEARPPLSGLDRRHLQMHAVDRPYFKYFSVEDRVYSHATFEGGTSGKVLRAVFLGSDAVTVLPWDPHRDRVLVIEQLRAGPIARSDPSPWLPEPVAGRIEPGDDAEQTALKETAEEARLTLSALHFVGSYYPSPGAYAEYLYSYVGIADLPDGAGTIGGLEDEAEDIRGHVMPRSELMARIAAGEMPVGPLILTAYWLQLNAERLQNGA